MSPRMGYKVEDRIPDVAVESVGFSPSVSDSGECLRAKRIKIRMIIRVELNVGIPPSLRGTTRLDRGGRDVDWWLALVEGESRGVGK